MKQNERQALATRLVALETKYGGAMRGRMVPSPSAIKLKAQIDALKSEIARLDREAAERIALEKAPIDDVLEVIAIPLLADILNDTVAGVDAMLRRQGVQETVFGVYTTQIRKAALAMVDTLDHSDMNLPKLLDQDDTLVDAVKNKIMSFIKQRLKIK